LVQGGANLYSPTGCCAMAFLTYDVRFGDTKLYPLEALKVGVGAPVTKPRTALGAAHAAADKVSHGNNVISRKNETWPWPNTLNAPRILYTTCTDQYPNFEPDWTLKPYRICTITLTLKHSHIPSLSTSAMIQSTSFLTISCCTVPAVVALNIEAASGFAFTERD
jgi:hypothetical protein